MLRIATSVALTLGLLASPARAQVPAPNPPPVSPTAAAPNPPPAPPASAAPNPPPAPQAAAAPNPPPAPPAAPNPMPANGEAVTAPAPLASILANYKPVTAERLMKPAD